MKKQTYIIELTKEATARWTYEIEASSQEDAERKAKAIATDDWDGEFPEPIEFEYGVDEYDQSALEVESVTLK
jgi:hypothetical protein